MLVFALGIEVRETGKENPPRIAGVRCWRDSRIGKSNECDAGSERHASLDFESVEGHERERGVGHEVNVRRALEHGSDGADDALREPLHVSKPRLAPGHRIAQLGDVCPKRETIHGKSLDAHLLT